MDEALPERVRWLIQMSVPTTEALELLIALVRDPAASWTAGELMGRVRLAGVAEATVSEYLSLLLAQGLLAVRDERFRFAPASAELAETVAGLAAAYNERPVTLIRTVYAIADGKRIRSFADAFRLKKEP